MSRILSALFLYFCVSCASKHVKSDFVYQHRPSSDTNAKMPAVILLHGYGADEKNIFSLAERVPAGYHVFSLRAPLHLENSGYGWFDLTFPREKQIRYDYRQVKDRRDEVLQFISEISSRYPVDTSRIVLVGFSQGAILALDIVAAADKRFWGAALLSGGLLPETRSGAPSDPLSGLYTLVAHGAHDEVVDLTLAVNAREYLESRGAKVVFRQYETGHEISADELNDLESWLSELIIAIGH